MLDRTIIISEPAGTIRTYINAGGTAHYKSRASAVIIAPVYGDFEFVFSDTTLRCNSHSYIYIPQGESYHFVCKEDSKNLLFNFKTINSVNKPFTISPKNPYLTAEYFNRIDALFVSKEKHINKIFSLYYSLFAELFGTKTTLTPGEKYVEEVEKLIIEKYSEPQCSVKSLASQINISEIYLRKLFARYRGISPRERIIQIRMEKAIACLSEGCNITECAQNVGYSDLFQFSKAFKKYYGYSPSYYFAENKTNHK